MSKEIYIVPTLPTKPDLTLDSETTGLNPHEASILGYSFNKYGKSEWKDGPPSTYSTPTKKKDWVSLYNLVLQNGKYDAILFARDGYPIHVDWDTMIAEYILHIDQKKKLEEIVKRRFKRRKKDLFQLWKDRNPELLQKKKPPTKLPDRWWEDVYKTLKSGKVKLKHRGVTRAELIKYGKEDVTDTKLVKDDQVKEFKKSPELYKWFREVEIPFCNLLIQSELRGVGLDSNKMEEIRKPTQEKRDKLEEQLQWMAGTPNLNLNSNKQMQSVIYEHFGWPKKREFRTKTGYSTAKGVFELVADTHAFARKMLQFNELDDLLTKFINPLPGKCDCYGRIHGTFNQCGTRTRRMSSKAPNLQQVPVKSELGRLIRSCFIPAEGFKFLRADYDQIEIRILAHMSGDKGLISDLLDEDLDIHTATAAMMFNIHPNKVTPEQRGVGKLLNFSIIYGKTAWGFAKDWHCPQSEAQTFIDKYFEVRPGIKEYIHEEKKKAKKTNGWVKTLAGLPLFVGEVHHSDEWTQAKALRRAVNYPIQGSSQDIIKKACVINYEMGKLSTLHEVDIVPVLFVHDEVVYELAEHYVEDVAPSIIKNMENAFKLKVPVKVSWQISSCWEK